MSKIEQSLGRMQSSMRRRMQHSSSYASSQMETSATLRVETGEISDLWAFTKMEYSMLGVALIVGVCFVTWHLNSVFQRNQLEAATAYMQSQTIAMENKADEMIHELAKYQNYDTIRSIAEQEGMTINKNNVRDLHDGNE